MQRYSEKFGDLLRQGVSAVATYERKNASSIDEDLGGKIFRSGATIQHYKKGNIPAQADVIETLVTEIVKRSVLEKRWARDFLEAARCANTSSVIGKLFPELTYFNAPVGMLNNLPSAMYRKFIPRHKALRDISAAFTFQCPVVLITSLGGMGKTSLAREVADHCLHQNSLAVASAEISLPHFSACVWATNAEDDRKLSLSALLDIISNTLEYRSYAQLPFREKRDRVESLLRARATLIVIDNLDAVYDATLADWVTMVPQPSKVLLTSRVNHPWLRDKAATVTISGMSPAESRDLLRNILSAYQCENDSLSDGDLLRLTETTGGNPQALQMCVGLLLQPDQTLESVLSGCQFSEGALFDAIFSQSWRVLDENDRKVLMGLSVLPYGATIEVLAACAQIQDKYLCASLRKLATLSLIEVPFSSTRKVYALHPIVQSLASGCLHRDPELERDILGNRLTYFQSLASEVGFAWNDLERLDLLDPVDVIRTIELVLNWCFAHELFIDYISLSKNMRYYYYVRGYWGANVNLRRAEAARRLGDGAEELYALMYHMNISAKQENVREITEIMPRVTELMKVAAPAQQDVVDLRHVTALSLLAQKKYAAATALWEENLRCDFLSSHSRNVNRRWLATCQFRSGAVQSARENFSAMLDDSMKLNFVRGVVSSRIHLAEIALCENDFSAATVHLDAAHRDEVRAKDRLFGATIAFLRAKLVHLQTDRRYVAQAVEGLRQAAEDFDRLGNVDRLKECQELMEKLLQEMGD